MCVGCSGTVPAPSEPLTAERSTITSPQGPQPWVQLVDRCALADDGGVYCLDEELAFREVPELRGAERLVEDPGCVSRDGLLDCVALPAGLPRGKFVRDPSRLSGTYDQVVDGCVIDRTSVRRCDFGDIVLGGWPNVVDAIDVDVLDVDHLLMTATLQDDGTIVYDVFDFETGQQSRSEERLEDATSIHLSRRMKCATVEGPGTALSPRQRRDVAGDGRVRSHVRCHPNHIVRPQHGWRWGWHDVGMGDVTEVAIAGSTECALTRARSLVCDGSLPDLALQRHDYRRSGGTEVLARSIADVSLGTDYLCVRSFGGTLACLHEDGMSDTFGPGWLDITP